MKETMSASTWALVCEKRTWRKTLAEYNRIQRTTIMEYVFGRWKRSRAQVNTEVNNLLAAQDKLIAKALWNFQQLGRSVTRSMRSDDKNFFAGLLQDGAEFLAPTQVKKLWAVIRRSIPKFQVRRSGYDPHALGFLDQSCLDHFRQLELGVDETPDDLATQCIAHQQAEQPGEDIVSLMASLHLQPVMVIWSDDLAVPIATLTASSLLPRLADLAAEVTRQFKRRGFTVNFTPGKTSAVVSFVGRDAPALRRQHLLGPTAGIAIAVDADQTAWLSFTNTYKHLGAQFAASHSCEPELRQRVGMSKATFSKLSRMVLCNRHFPVQLRIQFLQSLVFSKLFYGLGSWDTPSGRQMQRLRTTYHGMLRKTLRLAADEQVTTQQLLTRARVVDVRARIAIDRLAYARRVFQVGPAELQQILHIEQQCCPSSWISALRADLDWLDALVPGVLPARPEGDLTDMIDFWQREAVPWKGLLKRGLKRHRLQEEIMMEVHIAHRSSLSILRAGGATFSPDEPQVFGGDRAEDANAKHVMTMMQSSYDWHSLTKGILVLKEEWRFVLPHVPLADKDIASVSTPLRPRKKGGATAETPVQRYLDYIEAGGLPSPVSSFDSQPTRKFKDWFRKEDRISDDEEMPVSNNVNPVSARLRGMEERSRAPRSFKFGNCPRHGTALRPHIWSARSKKAGRGALVCSKFWKRDEMGNRPACWYFKEVSVAEAQEWPRFYHKQHESLQNRFLRGGRED
ncbi:unnamed protein product [Cladocopium goreaui]|uniref:Uncharacterized protein n=1 Tax=Cladocopium goreaui TaxID=2562237 RepID=A0A9P1C2H3_9DINO|nr:unnamed protein product [Cladocopium goreaui]